MTFSVQYVIHKYIMVMLMVRHKYVLLYFDSCTLSGLYLVVQRLVKSHEKLINEKTTPS